MLSTINLTLVAILTATFFSAIMLNLALQIRELLLRNTEADMLQAFQTIESYSLPRPSLYTSMPPSMTGYIHTIRVLTLLTVISVCVMSSIYVAWWAGIVQLILATLLTRILAAIFAGSGIIGGSLHLASWFASPAMIAVSWYYAYSIYLK